MSTQETPQINTIDSEKYVTSQAIGNTETQTSYSKVLTRLNKLAEEYGDLGANMLQSAFFRAGYGLNQPQIQNARLKAISTCPVNFSKDKIAEALNNPYSNEIALRQISQALRWLVYPYYKVLKTYADIPTYHNFVFPQYVSEEDAKTEKFKREHILVNKLVSAFNAKDVGHAIAGQALAQGKVFYVPRIDIDKSHNKVNYFYMQQLPEDRCQIIGNNSISKYTISFDMMYFLRPGTDWRQFGDLFAPYIDDFVNAFKHSEPSTPRSKNTYIYASIYDEKYQEKIIVDGRKYTFYPGKIKTAAYDDMSPRVYKQNGRWFYYVSLPIDKVWTFEIDDSEPVNAPVFAGLFQTYAQQGDYESAQLPIVMNPLIKIFTGEIPYNSNESIRPEDNYKLSIGGRTMFLQFWDMLMQQSNTGGAALYFAPVQNIKSHDYAESANANNISSSFNSYIGEKTGLTALVPVIDNPHQGVAQYSGLLESRFTTPIYHTMERMIDYIMENMGLTYTWKYYVFGSIYTDNQLRADMLKEWDKGNLFALYILAGLDNISILDMLSTSKTLKAYDIMSHLMPPPTSYTQSNNSAAATKEGGAPTKTQTEVDENQSMIDVGEDE